MRKSIHCLNTNYIIELYKSGKSCTEIGKLVGFNHVSISKLLKLNNIDVKIQPNKVDLDEEEICELYKDGLSITKIAKIYSLSMKPITRILKANNIVITGRDNRKHTCNSNYFETIDTEHKAYWLGFIMADGNVRIENCKKYVLEIGLKHDDDTHLMKFLDDINSTDEVTYKYNKQYKSCRVMIRDKKLITDLISLGCVERKSLILKFPNIKEELLNHFIRGYFDGDGSVYTNKNSQLKSKIYFNLLGTDDFLNNCFNIFNKYAGVTITKLYEKKNCKAKFILKSGTQAVNILEWLYKDSTIYLERKFDKYKMLIAVLDRDI